MSTVTTDLTNCLNCGAVLYGSYCADCGQHAVAPHSTLHDVLHEATHEFLHVDGKIFRTVWLLLAKPGFLTREYVEGRRIRYVPPLRLYLLFSVLYFAAVAAFVPPSEGFNITFTRSPGDTEVDAQAQIRRMGFDSSEELQSYVREAIAHWIPRAMFVLVPAFAGLVALATRKSRRSYPDHLFFALHVHGAYFAIGAVSATLRLLPWPPVVITLAMALGLYRIAYVVVAFKRAYSTTATGAVVRTVAVSVAYMVVILIVLGATAGGLIVSRRFH